jgi:hypothetical protein
MAVSFNPVREEVDGKKAHRIIWSTETINMAIKGLEQGKKLVANPFYENNHKLLKGDLVFQRTEEEKLEWLRCKKDILYFAKKCKLMTPEGIKLVKLRSYQKLYLKHLQDNRLSIYLACRQCGKTTTSAIFLLWYILFNVDKNSLVLGNKKKTAFEILDKVKKIYLELPYYLRPGIYKWNEGEIVLDNGCRCMAEATTINSGISFTFHCVLADEFAHVPPTILEPFYNNLFPTITAAKARFIITSTQNGYNLFYRLYKYAEQGVNEYKPFKTDWYEVPEWEPETKTWVERDEAWHQLQVANYGSEEAFNKQFGTNFDINANTLINAKYIKKVRPLAFRFENKEIPGVMYSEKFIWHPDFEPQTDLRQSFIAITIDIAEGVGNDYTTYCFNRIINGDGDTECIGIFHANDLSTEQCTLALQQMICYHMNIDRTLVSLETNMFGELFIKQLFDNMDKYADVVGNLFDPAVLVKYWNKNMTDYTYGLKITSGNKTKGCVLFKNDYERGKIKNISTLFLDEIENFCDSKGTNTYQSSFGHDDVVMSQMQLVFVKQTIQWKNMLDDFTDGAPFAQDDKYYNPYDDSDIGLPDSSMVDFYDQYEVLRQLQNSNMSRLNKLR